MPRSRNPNRDKAFEIYKNHKGNITNREIANLLNEDEKVIAVWKSRDKWNVVQQSSKCCTTRKRGGQVGNKNAEGHGGTGPPENKNAEKHGFFSRHLPKETFSIIQEIEQKSQLDILWENIQIAYAAIIRAQQIMYVRDKEDMTTTKIQHKDGENVIEERWEVQQAWDKQATFLKAQARAQAELRSLIKQYDEMLHKNWDMATEEQRNRIELLKVQTEKMQGNTGSEKEVVDDWVAAVIEEIEKNE